VKEAGCSHKYYEFICGYGKMRHAETIPGMGEGLEQTRMMKGAYPTVICCKNICKYHNVHRIQQ
jgi:hypothetical protein